MEHGDWSLGRSGLRPTLYLILNQVPAFFGTVAANVNGMRAFDQRPDILIAFEAKRAVTHSAWRGGWLYASKKPSKQRAEAVAHGCILARRRDKLTGIG